MEMICADELDLPRRLQSAEEAALLISSENSHYTVESNSVKYLQNGN